MHQAVEPPTRPQAIVQVDFGDGIHLKRRDGSPQPGDIPLWIQPKQQRAQRVPGAGHRQAVINADIVGLLGADDAGIFIQQLARAIFLHIAQDIHDADEGIIFGRADSCAARALAHQPIRAIHHIKEQGATVDAADIHRQDGAGL